MRWQLVYLLRDFVVAPHTFLRPRVVETAALPAIGSAAPSLPALWPGRPAVVAFLRHIGCPFAEATMRQMTAQAAAHPDVGFIAVTHSPEATSRRWCDSFGGAHGVQLVCDPARTHYGAWGVALSDRKHFTGGNTMAALVGLLDEGIHNRWASGSRWQAAATFAVDAGGTVRWRHTPRYAGDLPAFDQAVATLSAN